MANGETSCRFLPDLLVRLLGCSELDCSTARLLDCSNTQMLKCSNARIPEHSKLKWSPHSLGAARLLVSCSERSSSTLRAVTTGLARRELTGRLVARASRCLPCSTRGSRLRLARRPNTPPSNVSWFVAPARVSLCLVALTLPNCLHFLLQLLLLPMNESRSFPPARLRRASSQALSLALSLSLSVSLAPSGLKSTPSAPSIEGARFRAL